MLKYSIGMIYLKTCPTRRARLILAPLVSVFVPGERKNEASDEDASTKLKYKFSGCLSDFDYYHCNVVFLFSILGKIAMLIEYCINDCFST